MGDNGTEAFIRFTGVQKSFQAGGRPFVAVRDVSLAVARAEVITLVGPSGCGKSTLLNMTAGLPDRDLSIVPIGGGPNMLAAFSRGMIGGFSLSPPTITTAEKAGGFVLVDVAKGEYEPLAGFLFTAMISRDDWLAKNRGTAEKLVRTLRRGEQVLRTDPDQAREAVRTFFSRTDPAIFDAAWAASLPSYPSTPRIEAAGIEKNMAFMNAVEAEPVRITADQVSTNAIVDAVAPTMPNK